MGLGMPEVVLILIIALVIFGPRKLPELGKSLGQAMAQFRRASDEFKRTWEQEVEMEKIRTSDSSTSSTTNYDSSASYSTEADYNYGYDGYAAESSSTTTTTTAPEADQATVAPETDAPATSKTRAEQPHWI
jgi:TatA/E family protein of Tat protein translocase